MRRIGPAPAFALFMLFILTCRQGPVIETPRDRDERMQWWRDARFGLFIHWGLYAIPAGEWKGGKEYGEWIRHNAQIPLEEYDSFVARFNPTGFDADEWVRMAKDAGMKYIVITSKHHDGFALFDSKETDFDVMATPFKRDILKELSGACARQGIRLCFYHSIMDWHHPDYLPRRDWEETARPSEGAVFDRYVEYMKRQLKELVNNYGDIGVLWFDGEWETTWNEPYGRQLYEYVRGLKPDIIINNRVGAGRSGMQGMTKPGSFGGDFGTPEQEIPPTGLPGIDWEACMTMNSHWGYNRNDHQWKSSEDLIRMLTDIASKGGNYLLNVGPTAEGTFPRESIDRLRSIGDWLRVNGESIHGTGASPFRSLSWGRATTKNVGSLTRIYLHVFDWPSDGLLFADGLLNTPVRAFFLSDSAALPLPLDKRPNGVAITVGKRVLDPVNTVVVLEVEGVPDVAHPPVINAEHQIFLSSIDVQISSAVTEGVVRYTLDGTDPSASSFDAVNPITVSETSTLSAQVFLHGNPVSPVARSVFTKVLPRPSTSLRNAVPGLRYAYYEGEWDNLPDFRTMKALKSGILGKVDFSPRDQKERFAFVYEGYIRMMKEGIYTFYTESDDGSALYIGAERVVSNDGRHGMEEKKGTIALGAGFHRIRIEFFERTGGEGLIVSYSGPGFEKREVEESVLFNDDTRP